MLCILPVLAFCLQPPQAQPEGPATLSLQPKITDAVLLNPGMGIYHMTGARNQPDPELWFMKICGIAYTRCHWADLEPEQGQYKFDEYFGPMFDYWVTQIHKRVAFRVMCESMHGRIKYVTPEWVFQAGVPGVPHTGLGDQEQIDPVFWDPKYLDLQCDFIRAFGEWADGRPGLEFVDIGSIGEWGEMHFGEHIPGRWTRDQMVEAGFTDYKLALAYRRIIDAFADAFPHTRVFLNVGGRMGINDYAASRGIHFRQDGLGLHGASYNVESTLYPAYGFRGVQCNLELHSGYDRMKANGWDVVEVIKKGLEGPLSYQNINFGGNVLNEAPPEDVREAVEYCARHIGYRFALIEARAPAEVHAWPDMPGRMPIQQTWQNQGVAPCYENLGLEWGLFGADGRPVATRPDFPGVPTTQWVPAQDIEVATILDLPPGLAPGQYLLGVRLFLPEKPEQRYYLPMAEMGAQDWYRVGEVQIVPGVAGQERVWVWDFEGDFTPAGLAQGMAAALVDDPLHGGARALRIEGQCEDTWGYATLARVALEPGARYRLTGWMLVRKLEGLRGGPSMKVGINGPDGAWVTNATTGAYRMDQPDTWQRLSVEFDTPAQGVTGDVCVERGSFSGVADAEIYLDDLELRTTAAP